MTNIFQIFPNFQNFAKISQNLGKFSFLLIFIVIFFIFSFWKISIENARSGKKDLGKLMVFISVFIILLASSFFFLRFFQISSVSNRNRWQNEKMI